MGSVSYYRPAEGQDFKVLTGQVKLSGAILANQAGQPEDILIAAGQVVVTGPVTPFRQPPRASARPGGAGSPPASPAG